MFVVGCSLWYVVCYLVLGACCLLIVDCWWFVVCCSLLRVRFDIFPFVARCSLCVVCC